MGIFLESENKPLIHEVAHRSRIRLVRGEYVPVVNCTAFEDKVCAEMLNLFPDASFVACWHERADGSQAWRLHYRDSDDVTEFIEPAIDLETLLAERDELQREILKFL